VFLGCLVGLVVSGSWEGYRVLIGHNFHAVIPGAVYRCAQPSGDFLARIVRTHGIRTVINLRGCCDPLPWYLEQSRTANRLNVSQEDLGFSAGRLPSSLMIRQLVEVIDRSDYPFLFHCHKGIDRTGMASTIVLLLQTDTPLAEARRQLGPRFGHVALGRTANIDRFFDLYEEWLAREGREHSRGTFRHWVEEEYCPGECRAALDLLEPVGHPGHVPRGQPFTVRVRCRNTSVKPWLFRPESNAGIHVSYVLHDQADRICAMDRAGLFHAEVRPGESIDLVLPFAALDRPGRYLLQVDMVDEQHAFFFQTGSEPLLRELEVP
jgi:hypothetical protein